MTWRTAGSVMPQATKPSATMVARWGAKVSPAGTLGVSDSASRGVGDAPMGRSAVTVVAGVAAGDSVQAVLKAAAMAVRSRRVMRSGRVGYGFILFVALDFHRIR